MKKIVLALIVLCFSFAVQAQKVYFIYLQAENRAPFYVRLSDKIYSSSALGFLTLSNLRDSTYTFIVGFPEQKESETRFSISLDASDKGFLVKTFDEQLGLFDLQTLAVHKPVATTARKEQVKTRTDSFTKLLSQAANDESLLTVPVTAKIENKPKDTKKEETKADEAKKESKSDDVNEEKEEESKNKVAAVETKTDTAVAQEKKDVIITVPKTEIKTETNDTLIIKPSPVQDRQEVVNEEETKGNETTYLRSTVIRKSESSTTEGFGLIYVDVQTTASDTIRLLIPNPKKAIKTEDTVEVKDDEKQTLPETVNKPDNAAPEKTSDRINNCQTLATEKDFLKLRKNMAAENNDEEMIAEAKKYFKSRCFTTEQVRHLSTLFLTNAAKYQFFDAAYHHVSDRDQFASLGAEIKDDYYSKRFKALVGN